MYDQSSLAGVYPATGLPDGYANRLQARDQLEPFFERFIIANIPSWGATRCYIVFTSEIGLATSKDLGGGASLYASYLPEIVQAIGARWTGPGLVIMFNDLVGPVNDAEWTPAFLRTVVHEFVHFVEWEIPFADQPGDDVMAQLTDAIGTSPDDWRRLEGKPRYHDHSIPFARGCCHVQYRINQTGEIAVDIGRGSDWAGYGVFDFAKLYEILTPEMESRSGMSLLDAMAGNPPDDFIFAWVEQQYSDRAVPAVTPEALPVLQSPTAAAVDTTPYLADLVAKLRAPPQARTDFEAMRISLIRERIADRIQDRLPGGGAQILTASSLKKLGLGPRSAAELSRVLAEIRCGVSRGIPITFRATGKVSISDSRPVIQ